MKMLVGYLFIVLGPEFPERSFFLCRKSSIVLSLSFTDGLVRSEVILFPVSTDLYLILPMSVRNSCRGG
mgnify:CR=1 FL=1